MPVDGDPRRYAVPIPIEKQLLGTLCLVSSRPPEQLAEEQRLVKTAAGYLAPVLRNIHRYQMLEQRVAERTAALQKEIAERQQVEEALRESEARWRSLVENAPDIILTVDREGRILFTNRPPAGLTREEALGTNVLDYVVGEHRGTVRQSIQRVFQTGELDYFEIAMRGLFDTIYWYATRVGPVKRDGEVVAAMLVTRDITERKRAEEELQRSFERLQRTLKGTVHALVSAIEMRDPYTAGHQRRVTHLACAIAREMGLPEEQIEGLRMAGLLHDLGKITVPAEILAKPGPLNDLEYGIITTHPQIGHDVLKEIEFPWPVAEIVLQHHERLDGSGYPQGLSGEEIILEARILGVADVVEAMASHRPYRPAHGMGEALEEILQNRGVLYDPEVVDACLRLFTEKGFTFEQGEPRLKEQSAFT
ncbi:MAG TPA: PAS domain S-box protein [Anaerolineae bacterium]|nr:PAS domain S-box protein [Anaerolineae bacterium]